jgi:PPM family protein phosphatase
VSNQSQLESSVPFSAFPIVESVERDRTNHTTSPQIEVCGRSETGNHRTENQDAIRISAPDDPLVTGQGVLCALADGMGGYAHGGVASVTALDIFFDSFYGSNGALPARLNQAIQHANIAVHQAAQRLNAGRMGTTLTAAYLAGNQLFVAHVGDSRLYLIRGGKAICLTNDHTGVGELVRAGVLSPDKLRNHGERSMLTRCVGIDLSVETDITHITVRKDDVLILCSDGLWSVIEDDEFARLATRASDPEALTQNLIDLALSRDSDDNVSALAIHIQQVAPKADSADSGQRRGVGIYNFFRSRLTGNL